VEAIWARDEGVVVVDAEADTIVLVEEQVSVIFDALALTSLSELSNSLTISSRNFCCTSRTLFTDRVSLSVSSVSAAGNCIPSFMLNCSEELLENLRDFFLRRGGAIGPLDVMESVVFECASFVLAITSGSCNIMAPPTSAVTPVLLLIALEAVTP